MLGRVDDDDDDRELVPFIIDSVSCAMLNYWRRCRPHTLVYRICRQLLAISCRRMLLFTPRRLDDSVILSSDVCTMSIIVGL